MGQAYLIIKSFKDLVVDNDALNNALPGDLHHGTRVDTKVDRPYGLITVEEKSREGYSGGSIATYEATLKIIGKQLVGPIGDAQKAFSDVLDYSFDLPSVVGQVSIVYPGTSDILEGDAEFGKDVLIGTQTWIITIQE